MSNLPEDMRERAVDSIDNRRFDDNFPALVYKDIVWLVDNCIMALLQEVDRKAREDELRQLQKYWIDVNKELPIIGVPVLCRLEWFRSKKIVYAVLKKVDEDDVDWRTNDDDSEIDYSLSVTHWQYIAELKSPSKESKSDE